MSNLEFHPGATEDVKESFHWYERDSPIAALRFLDTLEHSYEKIGPKQFPSYFRKTRRLVLQDFPFSIVFRELDHATQIVAVAHAKRRPGYWKNRV